MKMIVKVPKNVLGDVDKLSRAIDNALDGAARAAKADFGVTTQTWKERPDFTIESKPGVRTVSTDNEIYGYVDEGTKPHVIAPKNKRALRFAVPSSAKTIPNYIGSRPGGQGSFTVIRRKPIRHPGTEARNFAKKIQEKWQQQLPITLQRAIDAEV